LPYRLKDHHLNHIFSIINKYYEIYGVSKKSKKFSRIEIASDLIWINGRSQMPPKKVLFEDQQIISEDLNKKIAFVGMPLCDVSAIHHLIYKLRDSGLVPDRDDLLLIASECKPDDACFCEFFGTDKRSGFDIYIQKNSSGYDAFSGTAAGEKILKKLALMPDHKLNLRPVTHKSLNKLSKEEITKLIEKRGQFDDLWNKIANNCFGCGACTAVCPLCYCFRQEEKNNLDGSCKSCINWDSCFAKEFSEVQNRADLRPQNVDRLYNWYHHKFVRSPYLCVGCGRCIKACPANLNIKNILLSIEKLGEKSDE
jgi:heterodisulfide reductase subunit C